MGGLLITEGGRKGNWAGGRETEQEGGKPSRREGNRAGGREGNPERGNKTHDRFPGTNHLLTHRYFRCLLDIFAEFLKESCKGIFI